MGLDIMFINPNSIVTDEFGYKTSEQISLEFRHGLMRVISWLPYTLQPLWYKSGIYKMYEPLYKSIRATHNYTYKEFIEYLNGLHKWILENKDKYAYVNEPKYEWQEQFFTGDSYIMFGDIQSINSDEKPKLTYKSSDTNRFITKHHIYWTEKRKPETLSLASDAQLVQRFIDELKTMGIPDDWIVKTDS